jgi:hypothetical protein
VEAQTKVETALEKVQNLVTRPGSEPTRGMICSKQDAGILISDGVNYDKIQRRY